MAQRFWEHRIRDEENYRKAIEYIHYNPVKHGVVSSPIEYEASSFSQFVKDGIYPEYWSCSEEYIREYLKG